jgi:uncharacterized protein YggE
VVQTAGNALEKRVTEMGETAVLVKLDQQDKNEALKELWRTMDGDISQLQTDTVEQNDLNNVQQNKITHLEKLVEDLLDRVVKAEDRANK